MVVDTSIGQTIYNNWFPNYVKEFVWILEIGMSVINGSEKGRELAGFS